MDAGSVGLISKSLHRYRCSRKNNSIKENCTNNTNMVMSANCVVGKSEFLRLCWCSGLRMIQLKAIAPTKQADNVCKWNTLTLPGWRRLKCFH
jgi:hypothetical protein